MLTPIRYSSAKYTSELNFNFWLNEAASTNAIKETLSNTIAVIWVILLRSTFSIGLVSRNQLQGLGLASIYLIFTASSSLNSFSFCSKRSLAVLPSSLAVSLLQPENSSSFEIFFRISNPSSLRAYCSSSSSSSWVYFWRISIICLIHRCRHVLPSMSFALGSAPSFNKA